MELDLNAYYCSSNLPRLYRTRARAGDEERAQTALRLAIAACERSVMLSILRKLQLVGSSDGGDLGLCESVSDQRTVR